MTLSSRCICITNLTFGNWFGDGSNRHSFWMFLFMFFYFRFASSPVAVVVRKTLARLAHFPLYLCVREPMKLASHRSYWPTPQHSTVHLGASWTENTIHILRSRMAPIKIDISNPHTYPFDWSLLRPARWPNFFSINHRLPVQSKLTVQSDSTYVPAASWLRTFEA